MSELRDELANRYTTWDMHRHVEDQTRALRNQLNEAQARRLTYEKQKAEKLAPNQFTLPRAILSGALQALASSLTISPAQMLKSQALISKVTGQSIRKGLAADIARAKRIRAWLDKFITAADRLK